jgi:hypothetical protein
MNTTITVQHGPRRIKARAVFARGGAALRRGLPTTHEKSRSGAAAASS